ncbi:hypothetical protein [Hyphomonas sp.]|uniref:hypothetical protein n=1 Tax=Hyphomonas sp. TaxID=87 RepID=UPI00262A7B0D|nr:hypothetical protein [Hyphomonas sp.]MDF1806811.1 hypothetical protein [Hyphomonas sp.]
MVEGLGETTATRALDRLDFADRDERHDEDWLQSLVNDHPQVLPITDLEPAFDDVVPVCRELPLPSGYLDNLLVTPRGEIVLVECKLWRNPQARREVVAQIIEYAQSLARWDFEEFDEAVKKATGRGLYDLVASESEAIDEEDFVDAVARNLRLGRFLLIVVGDGIQEGVERLADYLEQHAGFHFTLALVELCVHILPDNRYIVAPQIMARTLNIERAIVRIEQGQPIVAPVEPDAKTGSVSSRARSISEEQLFEALAGLNPALPTRLRRFVEGLGDIGVRLETASRSLVIRWRDEMGGELNLGAITEKGEYITEYANWAAHGIARLDLSHGYQDQVAKFIGGSVRKTPKPESWYVVTSGTQKPTIELMLAHEELWASAIRTLVEKFSKALNQAD